MCGIAGVWGRRGDDDLRETVTRMTARLAPRGPDGQGVHSEPGIALGHRRLAIIDLSDRGRQPMSNEDGTVWLTFNGEVYDHRALRRGLERAGHRFSSDADAEVLLHLYEEAPDDPVAFLRDVRGMFAFALWDRRRRRLLLARDRLGIKPLFYATPPGTFAFASDIDALTACGDVPRRLDWTSLYEYLVLLTVPGPHTIYRDVRSLEPGCVLVVDDGVPREVRYWRLSAPARPTISDLGEATERVESALGDAVRSHLVADVDVGAFLSGGIDSSLIAAMAADQGATALQTFSIAFPGEAEDEGPWARQTAEQLKSVHRELRIEGGLIDSLDDVVGAMDQPMALTSAVSLFHLSRRARQHVKVVLTGDGGDEAFGGYRRHAPYPAPSSVVRWLPSRARRSVGRTLSVALSVAGGRRPVERARSLANTLARDETDLYLPRLYALDPRAALDLVCADGQGEVDVTRYVTRVRRLFESCRGGDRLSRMLFVDLQTSLADEMLAKLDRMTMASGLEARVPLLDLKVVETAARVAGGVKRTEPSGKLPLRRLAHARLGQAVAERPKQGFNSPLERWMRQEPRTDAGLERLWPSVDEAGVFDVAATKALKARWERHAGATATNLFALVTFGVWARQRRPSP
jgi:asparagine synthase (glutamine-hydrolysing)